MLYASEVTAEQMTWRVNHQTEEGSICHPSDAEARRHFDLTYPDFAVEPHNVRLGLCTNGFAPHGQYDRIYSYWPVILTPYNLAPGMCINSEYMFLTMVIPGPSNPKHAIDVYLEPLIEELQNLWHVGYRRTTVGETIHNAHQIDVDHERPTPLMGWHLDGFSMVL
ncbi:UNVERIFIED_CONTAM: hypothetical protein Sradi_2651700 [Sesamum radiatum]|uniref:Uncharacterized protein n=1 Tax=Sesamum radiatum TaxID=300843 RepID=A0AAW2S5P1_SESRA